MVSTREAVFICTVEAPTAETAIEAAIQEYKITPQQVHARLFAALVFSVQAD